jgi:protein O-GlcNAc transferase
MIGQTQLRATVDAHAKGQVAEAESLYKKVLKKNPRGVVALHRLGFIYYQRGDVDAALLALRRSIAANENYADAYDTLGLVLAARGKSDEAVAAFRPAIGLKPTNPDSHNNLAAELIKQSRYDEAIEACRTAIGLKPDFALAYYNLGISLRERAQIDEAIAALVKVTELMPQLAEAYSSLGFTYLQQKKTVEAADVYRRAVELKPNFPEAWNGLGHCLNVLRQLQGSADAFRRAIAVRPNYPEAWNGLGHSLAAMADLQGASDAFRQAMALQPRDLDAAINLSLALRKMDRFAEAIEALTAGLAADPSSTKAKINLADLRRHVCDWRDFDAEMQDLLSFPQDVSPFVILAAPSTPEQQRECARLFASTIPRADRFIHRQPRATGRIRIGYLCCDFRRHATAYLMAELFELHDRSRFEVFGYSYGSDDGSDVYKRLVRGFDHFVDLQHVSDAEAARRIHADGIDILVDLKGYTGQARPGILVNKPAPIQVNFIGYPGTMGADFIDYIIGDPVVTPVDHVPFYTEKIVQLPHCYQPNDSKRQISTRAVTRSECKLPDDTFVFCSFNGPYKSRRAFSRYGCVFSKLCPDRFFGCSRVALWPKATCAVRQRPAASTQEGSSLPKRRRLRIIWPGIP